MPDDGGGNFLTRKVAGLPAIVWVGGAAVLVYFLFFRKKSGAGGLGVRTTGGGGSVTTGATRVEKGAVTVNITQRGVGDKGKQGDHDKGRKHRRHPRVNPGGHNRGVHHHRGHRSPVPNPGGGEQGGGGSTPSPGGPRGGQEQPAYTPPSRDVTMATQAAPYEDTAAVDNSNQEAYDAEYADMGQ